MKTHFFRWSLIIAAVGVYALVLGCVVWPRNATGQSPAIASENHPASIIQSHDGLPLCCVGMQIQRTDWIDKYKQSIDEIAAVGADTVKFVVDTRQENVHSTHIFLDMRMTPTPDQLADLIQHAKSKKLRVILMPIVLLDNPRGNDWRGVISPAEEYGGWDEWFESYRDMLNHFAWIAQGNGVDVFVVGSEFVSAEKKIDEWTKTIQSVRKVFHGRLTYSSNWDHYQPVPFWDQLDLIGMNSYWKFGEKESNENPSVEHIVNRWHEIQSDLLPWVEKTGKPLMFLEIGWFSQSNVAYEPWDYTQRSADRFGTAEKIVPGIFPSLVGQSASGRF